MLILAQALLLVISLYLAVMWIRFILDWARVLAPRFRPRGILLVLFEFVYTLTDPPLKFLRRWIKPLRVGPVALDLAWIVLLFGILLLRYGVQIWIFTGLR
ncbi:YggT family protein [Gulosibacter sp. 10]|uniref:YggT family protein n=1 Tax=Gulosibacter sp. 10 TaxID=1255570 RepID=UPI00097EDB95|nr:YggT family protein [Gulosibacter sp. 10]SJM65541.1 Possible membrane protein [Gulosibacter sp. 10]